MGDKHLNQSQNIEKTIMQRIKDISKISFKDIIILFIMISIAVAISGMFLIGAMYIVKKIY